MKVIWALLCEKTIVDQESNNLSLIEVIDELIVPAPLPQGVHGSGAEGSSILDLRLVVLWERSDPLRPEKGQARIRIIAPNASESSVAEHEVDLMESPRMRAIGHLLGSPMPFTQEGQYFVKIEAKTADSDWQELFELPLQVSVQTDDLHDQPSS